jgi:hypothetical protein
MVIVVMVIAVLAVSLIQVSAATHRAAYQGSCAATHQSAN